MEKENLERKIEAEKMWFKKGVDQVESGEWDPFSFIAKIKERGLSDEQCETFIPLLEQKCLQRINLLKEYQLNLRGDCVEKKRVDSEEKWAIYGTFRNARADLKTEEEKLQVLGAMMVALGYAHNMARTYEKKEKLEHHDYSKVPVIMYGFKRFNKNDVYKPGEPYIEGMTDDYGQTTEKMYFLPLPPTTSWTHSGSSEEGDIAFPPPTPTIPHENIQFSSSFQKRMSRFAPLEESGVNTMIISEARAYLNRLVVLHALFTDLESYDEQAKEKV